MKTFSISRFSCLSSLLLLSANLHAQPCNRLTSDDERLQCFEQLSRCTEINDDNDRLACYDMGYQLDITVVSDEILTAQPVVAEPVAPQPVTVPPIRPTTSSATAPEPAPAPAPVAASPGTAKSETAPAAATAAKTPDELFPVRGASRPATPSKPEAEAVASMTAVIVEVSKDQRKLATMRLDNGQVWREIKKSRFTYEPGMTVIISAGVFGSTNLTAPGMSKYVKVKRLK